MTAHNQAWHDGADAFKQGARPDDNPHPIGSDDANEWLVGYWAAHGLKQLLGKIK